MTQEQKILNWIEEWGDITVREAFEHLHINSPTKVISDLNKKGANIKSALVTYEREDGTRGKYVRYFI